MGFNYYNILTTKEKKIYLRLNLGFQTQELNFKNKVPFTYKLNILLHAFFYFSFSFY